MPTFHCKLNKNINGFQINLYEVDLNDTDQFQRLQDYIKNKIKSMKVHDGAKHVYQYLSIPNIPKAFADKLIERINQINTPVTAPKSWFDVRRSRATEFMSQLLLEREYNCIFYEEADKRINVTPVNVDKHAPGIDVPGILLDGNTFKFIVCEVKASKDEKIPCASSSELLEDIKKGYFNKNERLSKEILEYISQMSKVNTGDEVIKNVIQFLIDLIHDSDSQGKILEKVVFFPFLIRNNAKIVENKNLDDFVDFKIDDLKGINLTGIIWSFNQDIDTFCNNLYNEVLAGA